jgi:hypothetical protein
MAYPISTNIFLRVGMSELAIAPIIHTGDPGGNLGMERKLFLVLFALGLNSNLCGDS